MKPLTVREAAEKLQMSEQHVRLLLSDKKLKGKKFGKSWMVLSLNYARRRKPKVKARKVDTAARIIQAQRQAQREGRILTDEEILAILKGGDREE